MIPSSQLTFDKIPDNKDKFDFQEVKSIQEMVEIGGRLCQQLGLPRSTGQIFGLLYFSTEPVTLDQISSILKISKASVSTGSRQLAAWGVILKVWIPGDRKDYYEVAGDITQLAQGAYNGLIKPRIDSSKARLAELKKTLNIDIQSGKIKNEKAKILLTRIASMDRLHKIIFKSLPIIEKFIK